MTENEKFRRKNGIVGLFKDIYIYDINFYVKNNLPYVSTDTGLVFKLTVKEYKNKIFVNEIPYDECDLNSYLLFMDKLDKELFWYYYELDEPRRKAIAHQEYIKVREKLYEYIRDCIFS